MATQRRVALLLALAFVLLGVGMGMEGSRLHKTLFQNRAIEDGTIAVLEGDLPLEAAFGRAYWLKRYGRYDSAAQALSALRDHGDRGFQSALHYNLGNIYLGQAIATQKGSFAALAEESYRAALAADSGAKDAKYNLARLIKIKREAEKKRGEKKDKKEEQAQKGWRFVPGYRGDRP